MPCGSALGGSFDLLQRPLNRYRIVLFVQLYKVIKFLYSLGLEFFRNLVVYIVDHPHEHANHQHVQRIKASLLKPLFHPLDRDELMVGRSGNSGYFVKQFYEIHPIFQFVPSEYTGTLLAPPPATVEAKVVTVASDTNALAPTPDVDALGRAAAV